MRSFLVAVLGLVLVLGPTLSGSGHLHAAPGHEEAGGLHVDHVHVNHVHNKSGHAEHHADHLPAVEVATDHAGDDAVSLNWAGSEATAKRTLPALAALALPIEPPERPRVATHRTLQIPLRAPPLNTLHPGRAPPA